ncbi:MAG: aminotransferase class IV [Acidimicrobiales bacterium]
MSVPGRVVYMNGAFVPEAEARVSIYDSALMFGDMVFEMTRSFNGVQFKLREHLERLYNSSAMVEIPMQVALDELEEIVHETIRRNQPAFADDDEHRVMIDVSRGLLSIYQAVVGAHSGVNVIVADFPLRWTVAGMSELWERGINAVVTSQRAIPAHLLDPKVKSRSRLHYLMANIEVAHHRGDRNWALLLDPDGFIAEGTGDNFFIVRDGRLLTPEPRNVLRGISRDYILHELAMELGIVCSEQNIDVYDVTVADEAFMTGTPFCILPVTSINGRPIGGGKRGALTESLLSRWSENVGIDIADQIAAWDRGRDPARVKGPSPYQFSASS